MAVKKQEVLYNYSTKIKNTINFSSGAICLVFASEKYDENDYFREYNDFIGKLKF